MWRWGGFNSTTHASGETRGPTWTAGAQCVDGAGLCPRRPPARGRCPSLVPSLAGPGPLAHSLRCQYRPEPGGTGETVGPPLLRFQDLNLGLMEMYAPRGPLLVPQHGTFTQGGPGESGAALRHGAGGGRQQ